jgi:hypothetical protein
MKGIKSKHIRKTLKAKRLRLKSNGLYNNCNLTIRLTNITPKWKYSLRYGNGNIYKMNSWETIKVNIVVSGSMVYQSYTNVDGNETTTKSHEAITDWNEKNSKWYNRSTRRQIRSWIADGDNYKWDGGIGISKLLQLFGIPSQDVEIGTIRFED